MPKGHNAFYNSRAWRDRTRRRILLEANFTCADCGLQLLRGMHVHHSKELRHAPALGHEPLNLVPLCRDCHSRRHAKPRGGCSLDGQPLASDHPWNLATGGGLRR